MSIGTTGAIIAAATVAGAGSIASGAIGAHGAKSAADEQVEQQQKALDFQQQVYSDQKTNQAPYLAAGTTSLQSLLNGINNGTFGPGSTGAVPTAPGAFTGTFTAPTEAEAKGTPGYQFTSDEGTAGILKGAAAAGGTISGGTLKALDAYNTGLADSTYNDVFSRALSTFGTGLQGYQANLQGYGEQLAGYQTKLQGQNQAFQQLYAPAALGEGAIQNINNTGTQVAQNVGQIYGNIGNAEAQGTLGATNAITGAIGTGTNTLGQLALNGGLPSNSGSKPFFTGPDAASKSATIYQALVNANGGAG